MTTNELRKLLAGAYLPWKADVDRDGVTLVIRDATGLAFAMTSHFLTDENASRTALIVGAFNMLQILLEDRERLADTSDRLERAEALLREASRMLDVVELTEPVDIEAKADIDQFLAEVNHASE